MQYFRFKALPQDRTDFSKNEIPLCQSDIRHIAQVHGAEAAANTEITVQTIRRQGGVNPNAVSTVFPEGVDKAFDEAALMQIIGNMAVWTELELPDSRPYY